MNRPLRVLRIIARMNVGGPAQELTGLLEELDPARFEQTLAVGAVDDGEEDWFRLRRPDLSDDTRLVRVPHLGRPIAPGADLRAYRDLRRMIRALEPDLVHTHTAKAGLLGRLAALHEGIPRIVHTFHGHVLHGYFPAPVTAGVVALEKRLARRTHALLAGGTRVRDELLAAGVGAPERYVVVPPGVVPPLMWERDRARASFGVGTDQPVVGYVGRLAGVKRPDRLMEVANRVSAVTDGVVFLVGGGADATEVRRLSTLIDGADVRFQGWISDVGRLYAASDVVVLTSDNEGMPVSLIEAGMCARPVVASNVGSVSEVVLDGKTGLVVEPNGEALADATVQLLQDHERARCFGMQAAEHTEAFSMSALVAATAQIYEELRP